MSGNDSVAEVVPQAQPQTITGDESWAASQTLKGVLRQVPAGRVAYRGCLGLAMLIESHRPDTWHDWMGHLFLADRDVRWVSVTDIPGPRFRLGQSDRGVRWASHRKTAMKFGMPVLSRQTEEGGWDTAAGPRDPMHYPPDGDLQLFRAISAIDWAMSSVAFEYLQGWRPSRKTLYDVLGYKFEEDSKLLLFGNGVYDGVASPGLWMPRPYIAFPEQIRDSIYDRVTRPILGANLPPHYPGGLRHAFVEAAGQMLAYKAPFPGRVGKLLRTTYRGIRVIEYHLHGDKGQREVLRFFEPTCRRVKTVYQDFEMGDVIAEERFDRNLPDRWYEMPADAKWQQLVHHLLPNRLDPVQRLWFDRQAVVFKPGMVHVSSQLASTAAIGSSLSDKTNLFWDVSRASEYHRDDCDGFVFPTVRTRAWHDLRGVLPGDVAYDLHPNDRRYSPVPESGQDAAR